VLFKLSSSSVFPTAVILCKSENMQRCNFIFLLYFLNLLAVHKVSDIRQIEAHAAEPLVPDHSPSEVESAIAKLKRYKSSGSDQIPAELIQARSEILWSRTAMTNWRPAA
jgi:hypothetical protein